MGRPKNERVWKHYRIVDSKAVQCNYCDKKYKIGNVNRMCAHLTKCINCPETIRKEMKKNIDSPSSKRGLLQPRSENVPPDMENINTGSLSNNNKKEALSRSSNHSNMSLESENNMPSTSSSAGEETILAEKFAKAIIVSGAPLSLVEHPLWKDFFDHLRPSFKLPSRKALSTRFLNQIYKDIKNEVMEELNTVRYIHLQLDGWSNVNNEGVINFIISKPEPFFVETLNTEENRHTSEYLREEILKVMKIYGEDKFVVLIGDNARNIQKAFQLVKEVRHHVVPLNCAAHTINLLAYDVMKCEGFKGFVQLSTDVIKTIKKSQVLVSKLQQIVKEKKSGEKLKVPCYTRWGSYLTSLRSLKNTKAALLALAVDQDTVVPNDTKTNLLDDDFWIFIDQCIAVLEPITEPIFQLESDQCNIHTVYMVFKDMYSKMSFILPSITILGDVDKNQILTALRKRTNDCVKPLHLAAYLLDPKTKGIELTQEEELEAMEFINDMARGLNLEVMPELAAYKANEGFWRKPFIWKNVGEISPLTWWKGICSSTTLSKVAVRILSAPCTSAATERSFSAHATIHNKKRNRLTKENAAKITYVKYNWNIFNKYHDIHDSLDSDSEEEIVRARPVQSNSDTDEELEDERESRNNFLYVDCNDNNEQFNDDSD